MCTSCRSWPRRCRRPAARRRSRGLRRPSAPSAVSSAGLVRPRGWPSATRRDLAAMTCSVCWRRWGVACDIIAPSLVPVRAGDRVKTDRRDAKKLVRLYRAGELSFVAPPSPAQEGLRDLVRCADDLRCARTAARHRVAKQLLRYGRIFREGKRSWTKQHIAWVRRQRLEDPNAQRALEHMLAHLDGLDGQLAAIGHELAAIAQTDPWRDPVAWLSSFRGISIRTAL